MLAASTAPTREAARTLRRRHLVAATVALLPWLVGPFLVVSASRASWFGLEGGCLLRRCFPSVGCPGCGLTRSVGLALHGEFAAAWSIHPAGVLVLAFGLAAAALHGRAARRGFELEWEGRARALGRLALLVATVGPWIGRIVRSA